MYLIGLGVCVGIARPLPALPTKPQPDHLPHAGAGGDFGLPDVADVADLVAGNVPRLGRGLVHAVGAEPALLRVAGHRLRRASR